MELSMCLCCRVAAREKKWMRKLMEDDMHGG